MYIVKRNVAGKGRHTDYLYAWCDEWGTACVGAKHLAMTFERIQDAENAAIKAQKECKGRDHKQAIDVTFQAIKF